MGDKKTGFTGVVILALIMGLSGLGLGTYAIFTQTLAGKNIIVGILTPTHGDTISGTVEIRALIAGSNDFSLSVLRNDTALGTELPLEWNSAVVADGWWNLTIIATDVNTGTKARDQVIVYVLNTPSQNPVYYCSSEAEITSALTAIGAGAGTIVITDDITLSETIVVAGGGSYLIEGVAPGITVDCNGDRGAFNITSVETCVLCDLTIDAADLTSNETNTIYVEYSSNPDSTVHLANLRILGDLDKRGRGMYVDRPNVWVSDCYCRNLYAGIYVDASAHCVYITGNTVLNNTSNHGIHLAGTRIFCESNSISSCLVGIWTNVENSTIANNILQLNYAAGINCTGRNSTYSGNNIVGTTVNFDYDTYGVLLIAGADGNLVTGNLMNYHHNVGAGTGYGIYLEFATETVYVGNTCLYNDDNEGPLGVNNIAAGNNCIEGF